MPDLLTHVLVAYVGASVLARTTSRFPARYVPVAMVGGAIPDAVKIGLLLPMSAVEASVGVPFSIDPLHRGGGAVVLAGFGALVVAERYRRDVFGVLLGGAFLHLFLDTLIRRASGHAPPYLYPLTWWHPPSGDLYLSSDPWPAALALVAAAAVWVHGRVRAA